MSYKNNELDQEVQEVLSQDQEEISFEALPDQRSSPLNQAVVDKTERSSKENMPPKELAQESLSSGTHQQKKEEGKISGQETFPRYKNDAPEQEINEDFSDSKILEKENTFQLPPGHAKQAADTAIGVVNNVIEVSGGYFVKIRKHKEFYEFEEIISVIEKQNEKNVRRIKLDKEDQILLRPLLMEVLKSKAQKLSPEQQLIAASLSIIMKKVQVVMEVRNENEILVERLLDIIRAEQEEEKETEEKQEVEHKEDTKTQNTEVEVVDVEELELVPDATDGQVLVVPSLHPTIDPQQVMEVAPDQADQSLSDLNS